MRDRVAKLVHVEAEAPHDERAETGIMIQIRTDVPAGQFGPQLVDRAREKVEAKHRRARRAGRLFRQIERTHRHLRFSSLSDACDAPAFRGTTKTAHPRPGNAPSGFKRTEGPTRAWKVRLVPCETNAGSYV